MGESGRGGAAVNDALRGHGVPRALVEACIPRRCDRPFVGVKRDASRPKGRNARIAPRWMDSVRALAFGLFRDLSLRLLTATIAVARHPCS